MKKSRGILVLILTAIVTVFFCYTAAVGIGPTGTGATVSYTHLTLPTIA